MWQKIKNIYHLIQAYLAAAFYNFPSSDIKVIGVTGTDGKTTTVHMISEILAKNGLKTSYISSIHALIGSKIIKTGFHVTTPSAWQIQKLLRQAVNAGCKYAVLEVTSEGIKQSRHKFIDFDAAVFLNLTPEHLDSHGGFENYRNAKLELFKAAKNVHVINGQDENAKYFLDIPAKKIVVFGKNIERVNLQLLGEFNQMNAAAAMAVTMHYGVSKDLCKKVLESVQGMPGRLEVVSKDPAVVVDYAFTPEQLEASYDSVKSFVGGKNLICVLGSCGGGRDKWKRLVLGKIAAQNCREIIITDEDPYDEDPLEIMEQVAEGVGEKPHHIVLDRKEAIKKALELATPGDAVIITGKGAEPLMCLKDGKKIPWDDRQIVRDFLKAE